MFWRHGRETGCDGIWNNGKSCGAEIRELHQHDFCVYTYEQYFRFVRVEHRRLPTTAPTLALGLITFALIHITQFKNLPPKQIWKDMCSPLPPWLPIWFPINLISEIAVPISLSLRMFANVLSGTVMMALVYGLLGKIAIIWPAALHVYFDLFSGAIQTYVFCMLTMTYISQNYETE